LSEIIEIIADVNHFSTILYNKKIIHHIIIKSK